MSAALTRYVAWWEERIDGASLALFRVLIGLFVSFDAIYLAYFSHELFVDRTYYIKYPLLSWWPSPGLLGNRILMGLLCASGAGITLGWNAWIFCMSAALLVVHVLALDASYYMNHLALMTVLLPVCATLPMDRYFALRTSRSPAGDRTVARYELAAVIVVIWTAYFFGGISKLRPEWLNHALFSLNMYAREPFSVLARWFMQPWLVPIGTWTGLLLDLLAPFGLSWKKSRTPTVIVLLSFHILNHQMLNIGLFSVLMVFAMVLYYDPAWPRVLLDRWLDRPVRPREETPYPLKKGTVFAWLGLLACLVLASTAYTIWQPARRGIVASDTWSWLVAARSDWECRAGFSYDGPQETRVPTRKLTDPMHAAAMGMSPILALRFAQTVLCKVHPKVYGQLNCRFRTDPNRTKAHLFRAFDPNVNLCDVQYTFFGETPWLQP